MKLSKKGLGFLLLLSVLLVGFVMTDCAEAAKKKRFKFTRITDEVSPKQSYTFEAMISGDGKKVLYTHMNEELGGVALRLVNADGTDETTLVSRGRASGVHPLFISYDGSMVAFS